MVDLRRSSAVDLRGALLRAKKHLPRANASGLEDMLGQGCEVPSDGTSLFLTSTQMRGSGGRPGQVAVESVDRIRLCRASHMKYRYLSGSGVQSMGHASEYFRRVGKEATKSSVRPVAQEPEVICESLRILYTPHAPSNKGLVPPVNRSEGSASALGIMRALSRLVEDAARAATPFMRVFEARCDYLVKDDLPLP